MRKHLEELAAGRFTDAEPEIGFSVPRIELEIFEGTDDTGEFVIASKNHVCLRGMAYSSDSRMECLTPRFEGEEVRIRYKFHSKGLTEGDIQKGEFFILCNQCEYNLSFVVVISRHYADEKQGNIRGLKEFAKLAQQNWAEAKRIFYSPWFTNLMTRQEVKEQLVYQGMEKGIPCDRNMEEFLLTAKKKNPVLLQAEQTEFSFYNVKEAACHSVTLKKSTWGCLELQVSSDAPFLQPQKHAVVTEDFIGSQMELEFLLDPAKMHAGKNFGCITLKDIRQEVVIRVCASREEEGSRHDETHRQIRRMYAEVLKLYVDYRLKKIVTGKWAAKTCGYMDELIARDPANLWYRLFKAQAFLINGQRQEAEWLLNECKRKCKDQKSPLWAYYMYITTFMEHEEIYVNRLTEEIEQIYLEHKENPILFWCLLFLRKDYAENRYQKLKALEARIAEGNESPLFYVEAYCLFCQEPYLLHHLGEFEWKILNWARKQKILTEPLADQMFLVFPERLGYQRLVFLLLETCCEKWQSEEKLAVICSYLIKNQKYGRRFFPWYARGIEAKLKITGLYEAYLMSLDPRSIQEVPKIILMYFKYNNQLGYRQKAVLFVNIIAGKEKQPEIYRQYYPAMEQFAYEQMEEKHIDDNLAVIYEEVITKGVYSSQLADVLSGILFVHKLTCQEPEAARVIVIQKQMEKPQIIPLISGTAYFSLYSNEYCILVEDCHGRRYSGSIAYQLEKLMYPGRYLRACMEYSPDKLPYLLYYFSNHQAQEIFPEKDLEYFKTVMNSDAVSWSYRAFLAPKMFRLLQTAEQREEMIRELQRIDFSLMPPRERAEILDICIDNQIYEEAYTIAETYGWERISLSGRVRLLSEKIRQKKSAQTSEAEPYEEDESLLAFCGDLYLAGKYNDVILDYLSHCYQGATKILAGIWRNARAYDLDTHDLEERILQQMLYTTEFVDCAAEIYDSYRERGNRRLKAAYLSYFSWCYFVKNAVPPENLFRELAEWYRDGQELSTVCELALFRSIAEQPDLLEKGKEIADELLQKYLLQGMYFAFYKNFDPSLVYKYQLYDKYIIEYHAKKNSRITIHYKREEAEEADAGYITEDMTEMYEGIYVKQMILFFGDTVQYYISEENGSGGEVTKSGLISCSDLYGSEKKSRYDFLNAMALAGRMGDLNGLKDEISRYRWLEQKVEETFTVIT